METLQTLTTLVTIVSIVFGILNLILFFKIWGMTDNVKEILNVIKHDKNIHDDVVPLLNEKEDTHEVLATPAKQIQQDDPERDEKDAKQIKTLIYIIAVIVVILIILLISANR